MRARGKLAPVVDEDGPPNGKALASNPLDGDEVLARFYGATPEQSPTVRKKEKPTHYKLVCISLYTEDIQLLESLVAELKRRGHTKANKSQVIRAALDQIDLDRIPKGY